MLLYKHRREADAPGGLQRESLLTKPGSVLGQGTSGHGRASAVAGNHPEDQMLWGHSVTALESGVWNV